MNGEAYSKQRRQRAINWTEEDVIAEAWEAGFRAGEGKDSSGKCSEEVEVSIDSFRESLERNRGTFELMLKRLDIFLKN